MNHIEVEMQYKKSTPGTHVYENNEPDSFVPSLYIKKSALPKNPPDIIKVNVEWAPVIGEM